MKDGSQWIASFLGYAYVSRPKLGVALGSC
jgi:hypothetical protein